MIGVRLLTLFFAFALSLTAALAVVTTKFALTNAGWTDLGAGPMLLSFTGTGGVYAIGDVTPTIPKGEGFAIPSGESFKVDSTSHVWGMTSGPFSVNIYVSAY